MKQKTNKPKKPTKKELSDLASKVDSEGFGYYMLSYGPDLDLIERMGYDREKLEYAINLLNELEEEILSHLNEE